VFDRIGQVGLSWSERIWPDAGPEVPDKRPGTRGRANAMDPRLRLHLDALALARAFGAMRRLPFYCGLF
jgi:hypothetical protein